MDYRFVEGDPDYVEINGSDFALLRNPLLNKGMGFPEQERSDFRLHGLLPQASVPIETQYLRTYNMFKSKKSTLEKYIYLRDVQDSNETLFYYVVSRHIEECLPVIYTPGVGEGCVAFSQIYRNPRGLYLSYPLKDQFDQILNHPRFRDTEVIVVSDGERILGLGDQGAGGMGISIGKLSLYTACAGIHPRTTLPILLDTGTDNPDLLKDPLYLGWRHPRVRGKEYDEFIEIFVRSVKKRFPHVLLQWEDFAKQNANTLLERYQDQLCTFNDDIQGTAAIATGAILSALRLSGSQLSEQRVAILGGGSAGCGISHLLAAAMIKAGLSEKEAFSRFYLVDREGLICDDAPGLLPFQKPFAQPKAKIASWSKKSPKKISLLDVIQNVQPAILIGVSGQGGAFTEEAIRAMAAHVRRPIIFPLSNPGIRSEAIPDDLLHWTEGRAIIGTGSPFDPVTKNGKPFRVDQVNNAYIFPGVGLGVIATRAKRITDSMFLEAAEALSLTAPSQNPEGNLLPPLADIQKISYQIALAVGREAIRLGLSDCPSGVLEARIQKKMWKPHYSPYKKVGP